MTEAPVKKSLDLLFKPRNVVIYEAKEKLGYFIGGFQSQRYDMDNFYLISPVKDTIFGLKCYKSFDDLPIEKIMMKTLTS